MSLIAKNPIDLTYSRRNRPTLFSSAEEMKQLCVKLFMNYFFLRRAKGKRVVNRADIPKYLRHFENIIVDLHSAWQSDPSLYVGYSRGKGNYTKEGAYWDAVKARPYLSQEMYLGVIEYLSEVGLVENHIAKSGHNRFSSRMKATPNLIERIDERKINWASASIDFDASAIIVKDENKKVISPPNEPRFDLARAETNLRRINENLESSLINLNISDAEFCSLQNQLRTNADDETDIDDDEYIEPIDFSSRYLKRIFAHGSFRWGGRFYGGWWQYVPSKYRKFIEIEGCITCEMDYSTLMPRILYAKVGVRPPKDSYVVPGWDEGIRKIAKKAFNQLINSSEDSRNERQWHRFAPNLTPDPLPKGWVNMKKHQRSELRRMEFRKLTGREYTELLRDLKAMHEPIDQYFFTQAWKWLQRMDSDIAERVMLRLLDEQVTSLPIHDSFIVRRGAEDLLLRVMNQAFREIVGVDGQIDRDETVYDPPPGYDGPRIIRGSDLIDKTKKHIIECSSYHRRAYEWEQVWGPL